MFAPYFLLLLAGFEFETGDARCDHNNNKGEGDGFSYKTGEGWSPMSPEKRAVRSNIVFKGLLTNRHKVPRSRVPEDEGEFVGEFWVLDVYKGAEKLGAQMGVMVGGGQGGVFGLRDQRVNVSRFGNSKQCWSSPAVQKTYIVMVTPQNVPGLTGHPRLAARYDDPYGAVADYSPEVEGRVLKAVGWHPWSGWGPCSQSCGRGGSQTRRRTCDQPNCPSYDAESRSCNAFSCPGAVNTLSVSEERYFKPSPSAFQRVRGRGKDAWLIRPGSYFLLPYRQAFQREFPKDFAILLTLRPTEESEGIIFSINARNSRQEYISLELNEGRLELVHSMSNGSKVIEIPAKISDGLWHQMAISIEKGNSVRTFVDCQWITTQVLQNHWLSVPENADLIVGYMFQGEIEQLTVSGDPAAVSEQCSPNRVPFYYDSSGGGNDDRRASSNERLSNDIDIEEEGERDFVDNETIQSERPAADPDYLEEEYADLDWNEEQEAVLPVKSKMKQFKKPKKKVSDTREKSEKGAKHGTESSGNGEAILSDDEETGSGDGGILPRASGEGFYEIEWSSWEDCTAPCAKDPSEAGRPVVGRQTRYSRCADNGFLEECISAGGEKTTESRKCKAAATACVAREEIPLMMKKKKTNKLLAASTVTGEDIGNTRKRKIGATASPMADFHAGELGTNLIPRVPDYPGPTSTLDEGWHRQLFGRGSHSTTMATSPLCPCKNGGSCEGAKCRCQRGYRGDHCESPVCLPDCMNGGECVSPEVCSCKNGFTGARCQRAFCHPGCQHGGTCVAPFRCACPAGTFGSFCEEYSCHPRCFNGGYCVGHNKCSCPHGFSGPSCQDRTCTVRCENGGVCTMPANRCRCREGFYGVRCHKRVCKHYIPVREPQRRVYQRVVEAEYEAVCAPDGRKCTKTRPEYRTTHRTVYRTVYKCSGLLKT